MFGEGLFRPNRHSLDVAPGAGAEAERWGKEFGDKPQTCSMQRGSDVKHANSPEARLKHAETQRRNALAQPAWKPSDQPAWLTSELFEQKIQPRLANVSMSAIRSSIGVSKWYASKIRQGYCPHPRHWQTLAELVNVSS